MRCSSALAEGQHADLIDPADAVSWQLWDATMLGKLHRLPELEPNLSTGQILWAVGFTTQLSDCPAAWLTGRPLVFAVQPAGRDRQGGLRGGAG